MLSGSRYLNIFARDDSTSGSIRLEMLVMVKEKAYPFIQLLLVVAETR